jgi:hypothetical protein
MVKRFAMLVLPKPLISTGKLMAHSASDGREIALFFQARH